MATGTVRWFNDAKGSGAIDMDRTDPLLGPVRLSTLAAGVEYVVEGQRVSFDLVVGETGKREATNVTPVQPA